MICDHCLFCGRLFRDYIENPHQMILSSRRIITRSVFILFSEEEHDTCMFSFEKSSKHLMMRCDKKKVHDELLDASIFITSINKDISIFSLKIIDRINIAMINSFLIGEKNG